jgi:hypothetical protein
MAMRASTLTVLLAATLLAGCGRGSDGERSEGGGSDGVSKQEFVVRADAICAKANLDRQALQDPTLFRHPYDHERTVRYSEGLGALYRAALRNLRALEVPEGDGPRLAAMYALFSEATGMSDDFTETARAEDVSAGEDVFFGWIEIATKGQAIAAKYGLTACASFGMP